MTVFSSGIIVVPSGTTSTGLEIVQEAELRIPNGARATEIGVSDGGAVVVSNGGRLNLCTVSGGGKATVLNGGWAADVSVDNGGLFLLSSGASSNKTSVFAGGVASVGEDVMATNVTVLNGGTLHVAPAGYAYAPTVSQGGTAFVSAVGIIDSAQVHGSVFVNYKGVFSSSTVNSGGKLVISSGGTARAIRENGGHVEVADGATVTFASNTIDGLQLENASATIHSGTTALDTTVSDTGRLTIFSGGSANGATVVSGGRLSIGSGGTATNIDAADGALLTFCVTPDTYIQGTSGGVAFVVQDAVLSGFTVNSSWIDVYNGGIAHNTSIHDGGIEVFSGGTANDITVNSSGQIIVNQDGRLTGKVMFESGAHVSFHEESVLDFDLTRTEAGAEVLVNDLSIIQGTPVYTLTVSTKLTAAGTYEYALADGAAEFDSTISVVNKAGEELGTLTVGETAIINKASYTLNLNGSALSVAVVVAPMPPANPAGTKERVSWDPNGADGYLVEYSVDQFGHAIRTATSGTAIDLLELPAGTYQWRVEADDGGGWADGNDIQSDNDATPKALRSNEDGCGDVFFATTDGIWGDDSRFSALALHSGSKNDWAGTHEIIVADGKGRIRNLFFGSSDPNILYLTDGENGDAIFVDDVYSDLPDGVETHQARLFQIREIRAGAGDDIVDMTSQQFEYTGGGLTIRGGGGNDVIWANKGANRLFGDAGNDRIVGASGDDVIAGGEGDDSMHGGGGHDIFTFCGNWGTDTVEQLESGTVTLWFASGCKENWNAGTLAYTDGENAVTVSGVTADQVSLKFGDDGSEQFAALSGIGAFDAFTSEKVFEDKDAGILARL